MAELLYLVHRLPYPPDKGDKVRSFHLLKQLLAGHKVHLGAFIDDPADEAHLPRLREMCASVHVERLHPGRARVASLAGLAFGEALTLHYYQSAGMSRWVDATVATGRIQAAVVFSSSMAQYARRHPQLPMLVDFVDVDSAKWAAYADQHRWPLSWIYRREGRRLLDFEAEVASQAHSSYFATEKEAQLFRSMAPAAGGKVLAMNNGVDASFFAPAVARTSPFEAQEVPLVFTGAMDYWPNVDAVVWFAAEVLPALRNRHPNLRLHIVGRSPTPAVRALEGNAVRVTGTVPDVRPYLQFAAVVVAPLRLARGIQNKILEAMAMARPVVAAATCVEALQAEVGTELLAAQSPDDYVAGVSQLLAQPALAAAIGQAGRARVLATYDWSSHLRLIDTQLATAGAAAEHA